MKKSCDGSKSVRADVQKRQDKLPEDSLDGQEMVVSATECTGLAPAITDADGGVLSAQANEARLYAVHAPLEKDGPAGTEDESDASKDEKNGKHGKHRKHRKEEERACNAH